MQILRVLILTAAAVLIGRLYYVQVMQNQVYRDQADRQYVRRGQALFDRGTIYFSPRNGPPISAATLAAGYTLALEPKKIEHPENAFNTLIGILSVDEPELLVKIGTEKTYVEIAKRLDEKTAKRVVNLGMAGVSVYRERWRFYPGGRSAANVLGFVGFQDDGVTLAGSYGLERYYNDILVRDSSGMYVNFFAKIFSGVSNVFEKGGGVGGDIVTSIEPSVEQELERKIASVETAWKSNLVGGIIMDPKSGEIYAMAVTPSFDPNDFAGEKDSAVFGNSLIDRVYEMGSIIKPLTMAAGLDAGVITPESTYTDYGFVLSNGAKISNFDGKARGTVPVQEILNQSLNTGMAFVALPRVLPTMGATP
ncbi:MAG: penicillin-binding transpeptidase domain-containing protein, partial [Patescibacteria group bacterium]